jgi:prolyl-tRNA synthetase
LIGGLVMAHGDDDGTGACRRGSRRSQAVIVPIYKGDGKERSCWMQKGRELAAQLKAAGIRVKFDDNDNSRPGFKFAEYELKGVPVRVAMGLRDLDNNSVEVARRDTKEKTSRPLDGLGAYVRDLLEDIQGSMFRKALAYRDEHITRADTLAEFERLLDAKGGFILAHWDGTAETEEAIKDKTKATIRCIPLDAVEEEGNCVFRGKPSRQRVLFARAY